MNSSFFFIARDTRLTAGCNGWNGTDNRRKRERGKGKARFLFAITPYKRRIRNYCLSMRFLLTMYSRDPGALINLRNIPRKQITGIVDDKREYDAAFPPPLLLRRAFGNIEGKGGCNHWTPRGDGARKRGLRSQWLSVASSFSPATGPPSDGITFFVILVTCISLSWPTLYLPRRWAVPFLSFALTQRGVARLERTFFSSRRLFSRINTRLIPSPEYRDRE